MSEKTSIEWTESTWTPLRGTKGAWTCVKVSITDHRGRHANQVNGPAHPRWRGGDPPPLPERRRENAKASRSRYPERARARTAVRDAIRRGRLPRARDLVCLDCGSSANSYDHPLGYAKEYRLTVEPVCWRCHGQRSHARGEHRLNGRKRVTPSFKIGPKSGGRLLDGLEWNEWPA